MASRGIIVIDATIRQWTLKFGQEYANELRRSSIIGATVLRMLLRLHPAAFGPFSGLALKA